jgi:hypothetical protein
MPGGPRQCARVGLGVGQVWGLARGACVSVCVPINKYTHISACARVHGHAHAHARFRRGPVGGEGPPCSASTYTQSSRRRRRFGGRVGANTGRGRYGHTHVIVSYWDERGTWFNMSIHMCIYIYAQGSRCWCVGVHTSLSMRSSKRVSAEAYRCTSDAYMRVCRCRFGRGRLLRVCLS